LQFEERVSLRKASVVNCLMVKRQRRNM